MNDHSAGADKPAMLLHAEQETSRQTHVPSAQQVAGLRVAAQTAGKHLGMDTSAAILYVMRSATA
jgi:hypothetical protein